MSISAIGILFACAAVLLSRRLDWDWRPAGVTLWLAILVFGVAHVLPSIVMAFDLKVQTQIELYPITAVVQWVGLLLLFIACCRFEPRTSPDEI